MLLSPFEGVTCHHRDQVTCAPMGHIPVPPSSLVLSITSKGRHTDEHLQPPHNSATSFGKHHGVNSPHNICLQATFHLPGNMMEHCSYGNEVNPTAYGWLYGLTSWMLLSEDSSFPTSCNTELTRPICAHILLLLTAFVTASPLLMATRNRQRTGCFPTSAEKWPDLSS